MAKYPILNAEVNAVLQSGVVIPAHPLALQQNLQLDEQRQRLLTKYYIASGASGIAVGVHTTQFEIRKSEINLFETVLKVAVDEIDHAQLKSPFKKLQAFADRFNKQLMKQKLRLNTVIILVYLATEAYNIIRKCNLSSGLMKFRRLYLFLGFTCNPLPAGVC